MLILNYKTSRFVDVNEEDKGARLEMSVLEGLIRFLISFLTGMLIGTKFLSRCFSNISLLQIAFVFALALCLVAAFAPSTLILIIGKYW